MEIELYYDEELDQTVIVSDEFADIIYIEELLRGPHED